MNQTPYKNLPTSTFEWSGVVEMAKDAYWQARRDGKSETDAFLSGLDEAFGCAKNIGYEL